MAIKESEIRENLAEHIKLLDPSLKVINQEHYINMPNGRTAYVDILAKDDFGCFTLIELKKSDQTARSAIQQLMKYASMLKSKYRLEESQIRCVVVSTVWRELEEAFDEFSRVSQYEFKGYSIVYTPNKPPLFQEILAKYNKGDLSPLRNFIFFEFFDAKERDEAYTDFCALLNKLPSCNSVVIKMDYSGTDLSVIHPFGFSWSMFTTDTNRLNQELSKLPVKNLEEHHFDIGDILYLWQQEGEEYELRSKILIEQVRLNNDSGEYTGLALHSLTNTLETWEHEEPIGFGQMFSDLFFDSDDMLAMACGLTGDHPYGFKVKTTPHRAYQFNMIRKKLDEFLKLNSNWRNQVDYVLNTLALNDIADIFIYNPLNFFGLVYDLKKEEQSERIPNLIIKIKRENGNSDVYQGILSWTKRDKSITAKEALISAYGSIDYFKARMINQRLNECDEKLSESYGLSYEIYFKSKGKLFSIMDSDTGCHPKKINKVFTLNDFFASNHSLIDEVDHILNKAPSSRTKIIF